MDRRSAAVTMDEAQAAGDKLVAEVARGSRTTLALSRGGSLLRAKGRRVRPTVDAVPGPRRDHRTFRGDLVLLLEQRLELCFQLVILRSGHLQLKRVQVRGAVPHARP